MQCFHCGREVRETLHSQKAYRVDYYLLHTGHSEWSFFINPKQDAAPLRYLKLSQPVNIITCVQCYEQPAIRRKLDDDFTGRQLLFEMKCADPSDDLNPKD